MSESDGAPKGPGGVATRPLFRGERSAAAPTAAGPPASLAESVPVAETLPAFGAPASAASVASATPAMIGRYEIKSKLGEGGMGVVLLATDPMLGRRVALKVLHPDLGHDSEQARRRLVREAQAVAQLSHENVIVVHEVGTYEGHVYLAMEYVAGGTLRWWQADRGWRDVLDAYLRAGRGLVAAHEAGLVHRDFKPDNVLVGDDGRLRVTDFGLVSTVDALPEARAALPSASSELSGPLTQTGAIMGTPRYMAPEQYRADPVDARADQFAFCAALYEALYRKGAFAGATLGELSANVLAGAIQPVPAESDVPLIVRDAVLRGLSGDRSARYASLRELLSALTVIAPAVAPPHRKRRRWPVAAGVTGIVAIALSIAVVMRGGDNGSEGSVIDAKRDMAAVPEQSAEGDRVWALGVTKAEQTGALKSFHDGNAALNDGKFLAAVQGYEDALSVWNHPAIHYNLALALMNLDRPRDALQHLDAALIYPEALGADKMSRAREYRLTLIRKLHDTEEPGGSGTSKSSAIAPKAGSSVDALTEGSLDSLGKAQTAYDHAQRDYLAGNYGQAAQGFLDAYAARPFPQFLYNIGASFHMKGKKQRDGASYQTAVAYYKRYLSEAPSASDAPQVKKAVTVLEAEIQRLATAPKTDAGDGSSSAWQVVGDAPIRGQVVIVSDPQGATIYLDDTTRGPFATTPWSGTLAGKHEIIVEKAGYQRWERAIDSVDPRKMFVVTAMMSPARAEP